MNNPELFAEIGTYVTIVVAIFWLLAFIEEILG